MGCFCRHFALPPIPALDASLVAQFGALQAPLVPALSAWLSARWLPPAVPWTPDLAWLEVPIPTVTLSASAVSTAVGLVNARVALMAAFGLDPLVPAQLGQLARIVATLNLRLPSLAPAALDWRPWSALALLNGQLDTVQAALTAGLFSPANIALNLSLAASAQSPSLPSWRALLRQLLGLLPIMQLAATLGVDLGSPSAAAALTATIRALRLVLLPPFAMPHLVLQLIARADAIARLQASLGPLPFPQLVARVQIKLAAVLALLPPGISLSVSGGGGLVGLPNLLPNPGVVVNAATIAAALQVKAAVTAGLNWNVSADLAATLPLIAVGAPLASLSVGLTAAVGGGIGPVRLAPCDGGCDAARVLAAL